MKRLLILLLLGGTCWAANPVVIRHTTNSVGLDLAVKATSASTTSFTRSTDSSLSGNVRVQWMIDGDSAGTTSTPSDNQSNTYSTTTCSAAQNGQRVCVAATSAAAATTLHTTTFGASIPYWGMWIDEITNVASSSAVDGTPTCGTGTNTTASLSVTTNVANEIILMMAEAPNFPITSWTAASFTGTPLFMNKQNGMAESFIVEASTGAHTINMPFSGTANWDACAIVIKQGASGGTPTGAYVLAVDEDTYSSPGSSATSQIYVRTTGDTMAMSFSSPGTATAVSDGTGWTKAAGVTSGNSGGNQSIWYRANMTAGAYTVTTTISGSPVDAGLVFYELSGVPSSSVLDQATTCSGTQASFANLAWSTATAGNCNLTPAATGEIVIALTGITNNSITGVAVPAAGVGDPEDNAQSNSGTLQGLDGWGHYEDPNTSALAWSWTTDQSQQAGGVNAWEGVVALFKALPTVPTPNIGLKGKVGFNGKVGFK